MRRAVAALFATGALLAVAPMAHADGPAIHGAGSTWVQIALDQWASDASRYGLSVDYQGTGSTSGRQNYMYNLIDFAASEIPYQPDELAQYHQELGDRFRSYQYLPDVAGGTSFMYNIADDATGQRITNLKLSPDTIAKIFTGGITSWRDPAIVADNPGITLPDAPLTPVVRSDSAGSSAQLSYYLAAIAPDVWGPFASAHGCQTPCQNWPTDRPFVGQNLSSGVTNYVASTPGTINYVEAGYALAKGFPVAYVRNASGHYALPTSPNVATALTHATLHDDFTQDLSGVYVAPEDNAYPVSSYSYLITPTSNIDPAKGNVLGRFIVYVVCAGQKEAPLLGYSPLPPNLVQDAFDAVNRIAGHPTTPDLSTPQGRSACPNPTFTTPATQIQGATPTSAPTAAAGSSNLANAGTGVAAPVTHTAATGPSTTAAVGVSPRGGTTSTLEASGSEIAYARRSAARADLKDVRPAGSAPLVVAALYVPALIFLPVLRRRPR